MYQDKINTLDELHSEIMNVKNQYTRYSTNYIEKELIESLNCAMLSLEKMMEYLEESQEEV
jgi:hypothetical protein